MTQTFYQTKTVTDDTVTAQIPNSSRTCTHVRITFQNIGVTPSSVTKRKWTMTDLTHLTDYFQKDSCVRAPVRTRDNSLESTVQYCPLSRRKSVTDTVDTDVFRKPFAYLRTYVRVKF